MSFSCHAMKAALYRAAFLLYYSKRNFIKLGDVTMVLHPSTDIIANAQRQFATDQSQANLVKLLHAISVMLQEGANVLIPVAQGENVPEGQILLQTQTTDNGLEYVTAFSSKEAYAQGEACSTLERSLVNYFEAILQMQGIAGIIFNPTSSAPFTVQKTMIRELLADAKKNVQKNAISVWRGDITTLDCDAIVNAANSSLLGGGGVDGAIHSAAGLELLHECADLHGCATGEAKITFGYKLAASYVIHTVGPIYDESGDLAAQRLELANCYQNSLDLARKHHLHSIAFPAISTGAYGYPLEEAARIALLTCTQWLNANPTYGMNIILTCFNSAVLKTYQNIINAAQQGKLDYI